MPRYRNISPDALDTLVEGRWQRCRPGEVLTVPDGVLLAPALWQRLDVTRPRKAERPAPAAPKEG